MRTTLTLDDDVLAVARELADQRGVAIGAVISELSRAGIEARRVTTRHVGRIPITESGFMRISADAKVVGDPVTPREAADLLVALRKVGTHDLWIDDIEPSTSELLPRERLTGHRQVTDAHLIALSRAHNEGVCIRNKARTRQPESRLPCGCSRLRSQRFQGRPPPKPVSEPSAPITR